MDVPELSQRKQALLAALVAEFVKTAQPVGSVTLVEKYGFDLSPATIRHELAALEELHLIEQPHTSAGRIPTEQGFRAHVAHALEHPRGVTQPTPPFIDTGAADDHEAFVKHVAKQLAESASAAVIVSFGQRHVYYTGLSHLFRQPEFEEYGRVVQFSELIDRLDTIVDRVDTLLTEQPMVWIGQENPFGALCGTVAIRCVISPEHACTMSILGPMRMDYERAHGLLLLAHRTLSHSLS